MAWAQEERRMEEERAGVGFDRQNIVNLCIDSCDEKEQRGRLYHQYRSGASSFFSLFEAFAKMEQLYDELEFPQASTRYRSFRNDPVGGRMGQRGLSGSGWKKRRKMEILDKTLEERGECATFVVRVMYRQNTSWQGEVTWVEKQKKERFRSALELVRLLDSALGAEGSGSAAVFLAEKESAG